MTQPQAHGPQDFPFEPDEPSGADLHRISRHPASAAFHAELLALGELHDKKQADYGTGTDPFANIRASENFGIPAWLGAVLRGNDKMSRLKTYAQKGTLANEGVEDSLRDLAVYAIIALVLHREMKAQEAKTPAGHWEAAEFLISSTNYGWCVRWSNIREDEEQNFVHSRFYVRCGWDSDQCRDGAENTAKMLNAVGRLPDASIPLETNL